MLESVFKACNFIKMKLQHWCFPVKFAKIFKITILKNIYERLFLYFQYNSHHHFHYLHFHYHHKMHLYCLRTPLTIPFDHNMIPCLFQLNFFWRIFFSSLIPSFLFVMPSKRTQNLFTTTRQISDVLFILIFRSMVIYTSLFILI